MAYFTIITPRHERDLLTKSEIQLNVMDDSIHMMLITYYYLSESMEDFLNLGVFEKSH